MTTPLMVVMAVNQVMVALPWTTVNQVMVALPWTTVDHLHLYHGFRRHRPSRGSMTFTHWPHRWKPSKILICQLPWQRTHMSPKQSPRPCRAPNANTTSTSENDDDNNQAQRSFSTRYGEFICVVMFLCFVRVSSVVQHTISPHVLQHTNNRFAT